MSLNKELLEKLFPQFFSEIEKLKAPSEIERITALEQAIADLALSVTSKTGETINV